MFKITNISGDPANRVRRQSPVIGGARIYPGSTITLSDAQWDDMPEAAKTNVNALCGLNILDKVEIPEPYQAPVVEAEEDEASESKDTGEGTGPDEGDAGDAGEGDESGTDEVKTEGNSAGAGSDESGSDESDEGDAGDAGEGDESGSEDSESDESGTTGEAPLADAEETSNETPEQDEKLAEGSNEGSSEEAAPEFNYEAFFTEYSSITKIKSAIEEAAWDAGPELPKPTIEGFIEYELAGQNRSSLIEWFRQQPD